MWTQRNSRVRICATLVAILLPLSSAAQAHVWRASPHIQKTPYSVATLTNFQIALLSMLEQLEAILVDEPLRTPLALTDENDLEQAAKELIYLYDNGMLDPSLTPSAALDKAGVAVDAAYASGDPQSELDGALVTSLQQTLSSLHADLVQAGGG